MSRLRNSMGIALTAAALMAPRAAAQSLPPAAPPPATTAPASSTTAPTAPAPDLQQGATLTAPPAPDQAAEGNGGTAVEPPSSSKAAEAPTSEAEGEEAEGEEAGAGEAIAPPSELFQVPVIPESSCASSGVPPVLIPIYQRAAAAYGLGPQGPAVLAGINEIETDFGSNLNVSSAGAMGWMQFIPSTWETYGVDANGDGVADPYNPEDAIFAAARYLAAAGMPADTYGAIYSYNHADWYVEEVLANASCYGDLNTSTVGAALDLTPQLPVLSCRAAKGWKQQIPEQYLAAFEDAAARYELGRRGVWALAAVARLESNFGRSMDKRDMRRSGPLGIDGSEWRAYAVDGDEDGRIRRSDPYDSAATLARMIWARGSLRAGIFTHNQAEWYVQAVLAEAKRMEGRCSVRYVDWSIALPAAASTYVNPFAASSELITGRVDQGVDFVGEGPIVAIGDATVLATGAPGWPEGGGVLYQLTDGPLKGETVFVYEGVDATVVPGQTVKAGEQIATFRPGGSIEIGFADTAGVPLSHAEYYEGKVTESGLQMLSLLQSLGV